jgi:hypothetical protein
MLGIVSRVQSFVPQGIDVVPCEIETDLSTVGLPKTTIVGLPNAAMLDSGYCYPQTRPTVHLALVVIRKEGPAYDLLWEQMLLIRTPPASDRGWLWIFRGAQRGANPIE